MALQEAFGYSVSWSTLYIALLGVVFAMVWYDCGMTFYGMIRLYGTVWFYMVWHESAWYGVIWYGSTW